MQARGRNRELRTVDVARRLGCSVQQVRNLERDGVLPPAERDAAGWRRYTETHVLCGRAYRRLAAGVGPVEAKTMLRATRTEPLGRLLERLDGAHARLHTEREALRLAREAVAAISTEPVTDARASDSMTISELAGALGVRPSTLRHWQAERLLMPGRTAGNARTYSPSAVRDARVVSELRRAGYGIARLRGLMALLRHPGRLDDLDEALAERQRGLDARSWALLRGGADLTLVVDALGLVDAAAMPRSVPG